MIPRSVYYVLYDALLELIYDKTQIHGFSLTMNYGLVDQQYKSTKHATEKASINYHLPI